MKNAEWCGDLGPNGASCFMTLSDESRDLDLEQWDKERLGQVCTKAENFANWKAAILKLCKLPGNRCQFDAKKKIINFQGKIDAFIDKSEQVKLQYPYLYEGVE